MRGRFILMTGVLAGLLAFLSAVPSASAQILPVPRLFIAPAAARVVAPAYAYPTYANPTYVAPVVTPSPQVTTSYSSPIANGSSTSVTTSYSSPINGNTVTYSYPYVTEYYSYPTYWNSSYSYPVYRRGIFFRRW